MNCLRLNTRPPQWISVKSYCLACIIVIRASSIIVTNSMQCELSIMLAYRSTSSFPPVLTMYLPSVNLEIKVRVQCATDQQGVKFPNSDSNRHFTIYIFVSKLITHFISNKRADPFLSCSFFFTDWTGHFTCSAPVKPKRGPLKVEYMQKN